MKNVKNNDNKTKQIINIFFTKKYMV